MFTTLFFIDIGLNTILCSLSLAKFRKSNPSVNVQKKFFFLTFVIGLFRSDRIP